MRGLFIFCIVFTLPLHAQTIVTVAGNGVSGFSGDGGAATTAKIGVTHYISFDNSYKECL